MKNPWLLGALVLLTTVGDVAAQGTPLTIPSFVRTFSSGSLTRGFWMSAAPVDFTIDQVNCPNEAGHPDQNVEILILPGGVPPAFPGTASGGSQMHMALQPSSSPISASVQVLTGDVLGVLGASGDTSIMHNSYGTSGAFASAIGSNPVTLTRFGTQNNLAAGPAPSYWQEAAGPVGRIEVWYTEGTGGGGGGGGGLPVVPATGTLGLLVTAVLVLGASLYFVGRGTA
jgi:hypothetical protein